MVLPKCKDRAKPPRFSIYKLISGKKKLYIYMLLKKPILKSDKEKAKTLLEKKTQNN